MSTVVYDTKRIFFPTGGGSGGSTSADKVSIKIDSSGEISEATNVQEAIQMMASSFEQLVNDLPENLKEDKSITVNQIVTCINAILNAFRQMAEEQNNG